MEISKVYTCQDTECETETEQSGVDDGSAKIFIVRGEQSERDVMQNCAAKF